MAGSPLITLEATRADSQKEVDAIVRRGEAQQKLLLQQAAITRSGGRASLTEGVGTASGTLTNALFTGKTAGIF